MKNKSLKNISYELVNDVLLVSTTNEKGGITYANNKFCKTSGWSQRELWGKNHSILCSGYHSENFWEKMYSTTKEKKEKWKGIIVNKSKKNEIFYIDASIVANFSKNGKFQGWTMVAQDITEIFQSYKRVEQKNAYLEYAAKILRHDMHSGINTYIPRGLNALNRKIPPNIIEELDLKLSIRLIEEGLAQTQKIYRGVKEFTNIVRENSKLETIQTELTPSLKNFLDSFIYKDQILIDELGSAQINEPLFCIAINNLISNGLKYNDSHTKFVKISREGNEIIIKDNGRGLSQNEFEHFGLAYTRKSNQKEQGSGLGLNISQSILKEHGFKITCKKNENEIGTTIRIKVENND